MTCPSEIQRRVADALGNDPQRAVVAVRCLVTDDLPWLEERAVRLARSDGYSWEVLGRMLGRSRQAVRQRFQEIDATSQRRRREFAELDPSDVVPW